MVDKLQKLSRTIVEVACIVSIVLREDVHTDVVVTADSKFSYSQGSHRLRIRTLAHSHRLGPAARKSQSSYRQVIVICADSQVAELYLYPYVICVYNVRIHRRHVEICRDTCSTLIAAIGVPNRFRQPGSGKGQLHLRSVIRGICFYRFP